MNQRTITAGHQDFIHCSQIILPHPQAMATVCFTSCRKFPRLSPPATWNSCLLSSLWYRGTSSDSQHQPTGQVVVPLRPQRLRHSLSVSRRHGGIFLPQAPRQTMVSLLPNKSGGISGSILPSPIGQSKAVDALFLHQQGWQLGQHLSPS